MKVVGALLAIFLLIRAVLYFAAPSFVNVIVAGVYILLGIFVMLNKKEASMFVVILSIVGIISTIFVPGDIWYSILSDLLLLALAILNMRD